MSPHVGVNFKTQCEVLAAKARQQRKEKKRKHFRSPGDGRSSHKIPAKDLLWSIVLGTILRQWAFLAIEAPVGSSASAGKAHVSNYDS
jgi:hypothetical protein